MRNTFRLRIIGIWMLLTVWVGQTFATGFDKVPVPVTLQLQWKHQFQFAGYYAAIEKGFYREAGLDVRLLELNEQENPVSSVVSGKAQFGSGSTSILYWQNKKNPLVVLASIFQHSARTIIVTEKSGIRHVKDLKNHRVAMEPNCLELDAFLKSEGVQMDSSAMNFKTDNIQKLIDGQVDAVSGYTSNEPARIEDAGLEYRLLSPVMSGIDFYGDLLYTSKAYLLKNPTLVANFRKASLQGWTYAMDHPEEIVDLIYNKYSQVHSKNDLLQEAEHMKPLIMQKVVEIGYSNPIRWGHILEFSQSLGLVDKSIKMKGLLYSNYEQRTNEIPWKMIGIIVLILLFTSTLLTIYYRIIHKLRAEIDIRQHIQEELSLSLKTIQELNSTLEERIQHRTMELAKTNEDLLKEIEERTQAEIEMNIARQEAVKANVAKSEFLSRMSHELRTPMNSILGFAQLLVMGDLNASQKKSVGHIMRSGKHLLDLINEVLDISRIEAGRLALSVESVSLNELLIEMTDVVRQTAVEKKIQVEMPEMTESELFIHADRQRLKQVLLNILNNAVKYNKVEGTVQIRTETRFNTEGREMVRVSVTDTGLGISPSDLNRIFTPFERIGADNSPVEGTGLGLSVVKKLMDAMGGSVGVESVLNQGSTFWFEMPRDVNPLLRAENRPYLTETTASNSSEEAIILYVEDNLANIELVEQVITHQRPNYRLHCIMNGLKTVEKALEINPNILLLDMNLPDVHGLEILKMLKEEQRTADIPVLVISADAMPHQVETALAAGAKKYLSKPLDINELLTFIDEFLN